MKKNTNNKLGFTLIEILIAMSIFAVATVAIADIFVKINKTQRKTQGIQETSSDARLSFELMARLIRTSQIDYDYYQINPIVPEGVNLLALRTNLNTPIKFTKTPGDSCPDQSPTIECLVVCLKESCTKVADWQPLTPQGVHVAILNFLIYPSSTPFKLNDSGSYDNNQQPAVTIISQTENVSADAVEQKIFNIQTTVTSRAYKR